ncbi:hypothetical protein FB451DRAFT_1387012 [Mycena latifolia]|nr:hypothetical protein FB451DRAFT_1387012 [Mycena latifolia]
MSSILETASSPANSPALARTLTYVKSGVSVVISSSLAIFRASFIDLAFIAKVVAPARFLSPFPLFLYILAPAIAFAQAFYSAYIFLGVACITGALLGLNGRLTVLRVVYALPPAQIPFLGDS